MFGRKHALGLGLLLAVATSVPALAQQPSSALSTYPACTKQPTPQEADQAHQRYTAGKLHYDEGDYENAIKRFKEAYSIDCTKHDLLVIISATYEKKGDRAEAIRALETYVQRSGNSADVVTYNAKIENLKKELAKQQASAAPPPTATSTSTGDTGGGGGGGSSPPPGAEEQGHTIFPWLLVGVGAAATVVGLTLVFTAPDTPGNCNPDTGKCTKLPGQSDADFKNDQETAGRAKDQPLVWGIVAGAGAALAVGGLVWHFLEPTGAKESGKTRVRPSVGAGFQGLSVSGTF